MNRVILMGRLARDPEVRTTQSGMTIARMTLAVNRQSKDKGADFIGLVAWNKTAEFAGQYLTKGRQILIEGRIQTGKYQTESGENRYTTDVIADRIFFADSKQDGAKNAQHDEQSEIPF